MNPTGRQQIVSSSTPSYRPLGLPIQQYFDNNPFFVKDRENNGS